MSSACPTVTPTVCWVLDQAHHQPGPRYRTYHRSYPLSVLQWPLLYAGHQTRPTTSQASGTVPIIDHIKRQCHENRESILIQTNEINKINLQTTYITIRIYWAKGVRSTDCWMMSPGSILTTPSFLTMWNTVSVLFYSRGENVLVRQEVIKENINPLFNVEP